MLAAHFGWRSGSESAPLGKIKEQNWYGPDGMEQLRTSKEPKQSIPTFAETVALLMKVRFVRVLCPPTLALILPPLA